MFEDLRRAFREAVSNFKEELGRNDVPEVMDQLLRQMVQEMTDSKAYLLKLESDIAVAEKRLARETAEAKTARRRHSMATGISDEETAKIALQFTEKHEQEVTILTQKLEAFRGEQKLRTFELEQMAVKFKEARAQRQTLTATAGRSQARGTLGEADDLFAELDRMEAKIDGTEHDAAAADELADALGTPRRDRGLEAEFDNLGRHPDMPSVDERLEELKRRMGK